MFSLVRRTIFHKQPWYVVAARGAPFSSTSRAFEPILPTPADSLVWRQCRGKRFDGQRCQRKVKADLLCTNENELYCHSHRLAFTLSRKQTTQVHDPLHDGWNLWIDEKIRNGKKTKIRQEMSKPVSDNDEPGYIYAYMLGKGPRVSTTRFAYFKIGRTIDPHRRMYQVTKLCKYTPEILEIFPHLPEELSSFTTLPKCPISHRVERLIHLELSGRFPKAGFQCNECGTAHREWFRVPRVKGGVSMTNQELWLKQIRPVILKWVQYGVAVSAMLDGRT
ncbi:meiotically up-regulated gene 113-domain-containing protein [Fennellomyces sp. T-0311]|nr:meiotically up-regulated gene 113-domain-containing protein [Fennellomyces sp. T-0311]